MKNLGIVAGLAVLSIGCMDFEGLEGERPIHSNVDDWRNEIIYQVMVDRFANGDLANDYRVVKSAPARYHGGDWRGLEQHLDYISDLGVTAIWISPLVKNVETDAGVDAYHGYWTQDFTQLNPHFGDLTSLRRMIDAAHERDIKVILDIVVNHVGQLFYYDINLNGQPDERVEGAGTVVSPKPDPGKCDPNIPASLCQTSPTGHINEYDPDYDPRGVQAWTSLGEAGPAPIVFAYDPESNHMPPKPNIFQEARAYNRRGRVWEWNDEQTLLGDFPGGLKDVNTMDPDVRATLIDVFARWVELTDIDGFRIDTLKHVEHEFWSTFAPAIRHRLAAKGKQRFFMFGESFDGRDDHVGPYTKNDEVDSAFYFPQYYTAIRDVFQDRKGTKQIENLFAARFDPNGFYGTVPHEGGIGIPPNKAMVNFLDNHDVGRFLFFRNDAQALDNALLFLMTEDGIPCIYYGTEQGFSGGNDPANREDLWTSGYSRSNPHFKWLSRLTRIRRAYPALTHGDLKVIWSTDHTGAEPDAGIFAFERAGGDAGNAYALVVINTNADHASSPEDAGNAAKSTAAPGTKLVNVLDPTETVTIAADGSVKVTVPATSGKIFVPEAELVPGL